MHLRPLQDKLTDPLLFSMTVHNMFGGQKPVRAGQAMWNALSLIQELHANELQL